MRTFTTVICLNTNSEYDVTRFNSVLSPSIKFIKNKIHNGSSNDLVQAYNN
jgi:hypothetical protein